MADTIIKVDEVQVAPRGRKKVLNPKLVEAFKSLKKGEAIALTDTFGQVAPEQKQSVSATIRKNWSAARDDKPRINYTPDGVPQVMVRPATASK